MTEAPSEQPTGLPFFCYNKNGRFSTENLPFLCHCEAATRPWQSLSQRYGIPHRSTGARSKKKSLSQKRDSLRCHASSFFILWFCFVPPYHISLRNGKPFRQRLPRRAQKLRPPRNDTKLVGFCENPTSFLHWNVCIGRGAIPRKKRPHKTKNVRFPNKNVPILCHYEERSDVAILKLEVWHPGTKRGSTKQEEIPITKKGIRCVVLLPLSSFYGSVSFRATIVRSGMTNRSVKDCRVGRTRPSRNDKTGRFCGKTEQFPE